jgi:transposase-like protein
MSMSNQQVKQRRQFSAPQKVAILREHLVEKMPVSDVCDRHGLNPTVFYRWQKAFFANGAAAFERGDEAPRRRLEARVEKLQAKLARKDEVIAELLEDHVRLKKTLGES